MPESERTAATNVFPDVFADAISVAGNPYAMALTFLLSDPDQQGDRAAARVVARVRLTPELARTLGEALGQAGKHGAGAKP